MWSLPNGPRVIDMLIADNQKICRLPNFVQIYFVLKE